LKDDNVDWKIINCFQKLWEYEADWEALVCASNHSFFNSPQWLKLWVKHYWQDEWKLNVLLAFSNKELIAVAPLYIKPNSVINRLSELFLLGTGEPEKDEVCSEYIDFIIKNPTEQLLSNLHSKIIKLPFLRLEAPSMLSDSNILKVFRDSTVASSKTHHVRYLHQGRNFKLSKNNTKKLTRQRSLMRKHNIKFQWLRQEDFEKGLNELQKLHTERWKNSCSKGVFKSEKFMAFHIDSIKKHRHHVQFSVLTSDDKIIAINYYFDKNNTYYFYQSGWVLDNLPKNFSPGFLLHNLSIQSSNAEFYDFMKGNKIDSYKQSFNCNKIAPMCDLIVYKSRLVFNMIRLYQLIKRKIGK